MAPDTDDERREDAVEAEREDHEKIREAVSGNDEAALSEKLNRFEGRVEDVEEKAQTDPAAKRQLEKVLLQEAAKNFPRGVQAAGGGPAPNKIVPGSEGALNFMIGHTKDLKKVVLDFKVPIQFLQFTPTEAFALSKTIRKHAKKCRG